MKKKNKKQMRLSEQDLAVVLEMRNEPKNKYKISVDSQSTYRLNLSRDEEDAVAKARILRMLNDSKYLMESINHSLAYIFKDYEISVTIKNKITNNVTSFMTDNK